MFGAIAPEYSPYVGLLLLVAIFGAFASERRPPVVVAVLGGVMMMVLGLISPGELLGVFSNTAPVTIAAMFVLSGPCSAPACWRACRAG